MSQRKWRWLRRLVYRRLQSIIRTPWCQYVSQENEIKRTRRRHSPATPLIIIMLLRASPQLQSHWTKKEVYIDVKKDDLLSLYTNWAVSIAVTYCHIGYGLIYTREGGIQGQYTGAMNIIAQLGEMFFDLWYIGAIDHYSSQYRYHSPLKRSRPEMNVQ